MTERYEHPSYLGWLGLGRPTQPRSTQAQFTQARSTQARSTQTQSSQAQSNQTQSNQTQSNQTRASALAGPFALYRPTSRHSARACCCAAQPAVIVMLPPAEGRPHATDLLLCGHHFRKSRTGLLAEGAVFLDLEACPLATDEWLLPAAGR